MTDQPAVTPVGSVRPLRLAKAARIGAVDGWAAAVRHAAHSRRCSGGTLTVTVPSASVVGGGAGPGRGHRGRGGGRPGFLTEPSPARTTRVGGRAAVRESGNARRGAGLLRRSQPQPGAPILMETGLSAGIPDTRHQGGPGRGSAAEASSAPRALPRRGRLQGCPRLIVGSTAGIWGDVTTNPR